MKEKKCKICLKKFKPTSSLQTVCSPLCAIEKARKDRAKESEKHFKNLKKKRKQDLNGYLKHKQNAINTLGKETVVSLAYPAGNIILGNTTPDTIYQLKQGLN